MVFSLASGRIEVDGHSTQLVEDDGVGGREGGIKFNVLVFKKHISVYLFSVV